MKQHSLYVVVNSAGEYLTFWPGFNTAEWFNTFTEYAICDNADATQLAGEWSGKVKKVTIVEEEDTE